ncbi:DUF1906 domain-containing protein [Kribbella caucasensis]|uniref:DUF1906 domain-containing protein n=1 Tax=Kribbella caucasensis TaxID=2512215 RepID=UPI001EDEF937|nr:DUF1906 domain-containing protein [Kribbella sp. VKM Ac-2527]
MSDQTISYRGYQVTVPADWQVVDLAKNPTACVRFDRPAVYLGRSTAQPDCPSHLVGRSEGLVLEPLTRAPRSSEGRIQQAVRDAGVLVTAYYAPAGAETARKVLSTGRVTSKTFATAEPQATAAAAAPTVVATGTLNGFAFDACDAPSQSTMDAWRYPNSGYKALGIYISGEMRSCDLQPNLTPTWVSTNAAKGWQFLLIDVSLQAPCVNQTNLAKMSSDPATARAQGRAAAANAVSAAQALGFAPRSAIYSDLEGYTPNAPCTAAVLSYVSGWTLELNTRGYVGGVYTGAASGGVDLSNNYNNTAYTRPDNLWFARWNNVTNTTDDRYIPASYWTNHQRVHQYSGPHNETHGGVTINIDSNAVNLTAPPAPVTGFDATGQYSTATLRWTIPAGTSLGQVIVRRNSGLTPPPMPNVGTPVYAGTASSTTATGLANSTSYAFRAWVKDSSGKIGPGVDTVLVGTGATVAASTPSITYGGAVTLYTRATRKDNGASLVGVPLSLYARAKNSSTWREVARVTSNSTGQASSVQKPTVSTVYAWGYNGSADFLGSRSGNATIEVRPLITANLSVAAIKLGQTTTFYGYMRPQHPGTTVYLQRQSGTTWPTVATTKLNSTGNYAFSIKPGARGTYNYRAVWLADADHATTVSPPKTLTVS